MNDANDEAQNKLLKTIEEPPKNVHFILCSSSERSLLKTVLSRSKKIELDLIDNEKICEMLKEIGVGEKEGEIYAACSGGVFLRAQKMATDKEFMSLYKNIFNCLMKMNSSRDVLGFSSIFSSKIIDKEEFANLFMLITRDVCMVKAGNKNLVNNKHMMKELEIISNEFSLEALYKIIDFCLRFKEDLVYNVNVGAAVDEFLLKLTEVKVKCKR